MGRTHLTSAERYQIEQFLAQGLSVRVIANRLARSCATIYRELKRGALPDGRYQACGADYQRSLRALQSAANHRVKQASLWKMVRRYLERDWSPEQVSAQLRIDAGRCADWARCVSAPAIYVWIKRYADELRSHLRYLKDHRQLRQPGYRGGALPADRPRIEARSAAVEHRLRFGHWEVDTVHFHAGGVRLVTLIERKSRYVMIRRVRSGTALEVGQAICLALADQLVKSLTFDNGSEFAGYKWIASRLGCKVFFANAYSPWQRGSNENTNGLIRQYLPRYKRASLITSQYVAGVQRKLNSRPRKCLRFRTPSGVLSKASPVATRT